jgi:hypothetical protein
VGAAFPDMIVGRLPARDPETLEDMLLLIEDYEEEITGTPPSNVQYRRYLTRLAGTDNDGQSTEDIWEPSPDWTEGLKDWMGYSWDNYYCGDANDQTSSDGSTMSSDDWVDACNTVFERGSHVAFYSDHGDFHMFSAGLDWSEGGPDNFGTPDSTFDDIDVQQLASETHWHPFVLMFCCSAGTFDHMESDHDHGNAFECLCHADTPEPYDFGSDCLAEEFVLNTECGAIGVFASSGPSGTSLYGPMGMAMLKAIYYRGISRLGDVIQAGRLESLDDFWDGEEWLKDLGQFNLLGDPALDIGDRMKYRGIYCDLVVSPEDLEIAAYPTVPAGSSTGTMDLQVTTRNIGWYASSACDAELEVVWNSAISILEARCPALDPGESTALSFEWTIPDGIEINDEIELTAAVDTEDDCTESWEVNNEATGVVYYQGGFPNDDGWPVRLTGSIYSPPILADLDLDGDMEIIAINGWMISAISSDDQSVLWSAGPYHFQKDIANQGYSVAAVGDVTGDAHPEIVFDTRYRLVVLSYTGVEIDTFEHGRLLGTIVWDLMV